MAYPELAVRGAAFPGLEGQSLDLLVQDGKVLELLPAAQAAEIKAETEVDAKGLMLLPSLSDAHCHLRDPGFEWKEDLASGLAAAAAGGFSNLMCMANTSPVNDCAAVTLQMLAKAKSLFPHGPRLFPIGALTLGLNGKELAPMGELAKAGCRAFSNDGRCVPNSEIFRRALEYASDLGLKVIDHCEDPHLGAGSGVNEGRISSRLGLRGQPTVGEALHVARDVLLAEYLNLPVHLAHISCRQSVELIAQAKRKGVAVTAETCPHYLVFCEDQVMGYNTAAKVSPPLRTPDDVAALRQGLREGVIDILATDHAPHAQHEKETPFEEAPCGISGFETALSLTYSLVSQGELSAARLVNAWCHAPAEIFGLPANRFEPGDPADFLLFDPAASWLVTPDALRSKGKNTPCLGQTLQGRIRAHYLSGQKIV